VTFVSNQTTHPDSVVVYPGLSTLSLGRSTGELNAVAMSCLHLSHGDSTSILQQMNSTDLTELA
jgi:hypothetical protein